MTDLIRLALNLTLCTTYLGPNFPPGTQSIRSIKTDLEDLRARRNSNPRLEHGKKRNKWKTRKSEFYCLRKRSRGSGCSLLVFLDPSRTEPKPHSKKGDQFDQFARDRLDEGSCAVMLCTTTMITNHPSNDEEGRSGSALGLGGARLGRSQREDA